MIWTLSEKPKSSDVEDFQMEMISQQIQFENAFELNERELL